MVTVHRAPELATGVQISEFLVCFLSLCSALLSEPFVLRSYFTGAKDIAVPGVFLSLPKAVHSFVQSVAVFHVLSG